MVTLKEVFGFLNIEMQLKPFCNTINKRIKYVQCDYEGFFILIFEALYHTLHLWQ